MALRPDSWMESLDLTVTLPASATPALALEIALAVLKPGGGLVLKVFHGGGAAELMAALKTRFAEVRTFKPPASRRESAETYVIAKRLRAGLEKSEKIS